MGGMSSSRISDIQGTSRPPPRGGGALPPLEKMYAPPWLSQGGALAPPWDRNPWKMCL